MGSREPRVRPHTTNDGYFGTSEGCERWRSWARGHDRSAEYDGSSTVIRRSWYGRVASPTRSRG
jgi:hypothetical protein